MAENPPDEIRVAYPGELLSHVRRQTAALERLAELCEVLLTKPCPNCSAWRRDNPSMKGIICNVCKDTRRVPVDIGIPDP
jgi:hypothetical protein